MLSSKSSSNLIAPPLIFREGVTAYFVLLCSIYKIELEIWNKSVILLIDKE